MFRQLSLPQHDLLRQEKRNAQLQRMQKRYAFSLDYNGNIATIDKLPRREKQDLYYLYKSLQRILPLIPSVPGLLKKFIKFRFFGKPFERLDDYFFFDKTPFPDPRFRENFWDDFYFGRQCVAGTNPVMIEGVNENNPLPDTFKVTTAELPLSDMSLQAALSEGRLFMSNYAMLKRLTMNRGMVDGLQKHLKAPIALFFLQDDGHLRPLAVQLGCNPSPAP